MHGYFVLYQSNIDSEDSIPTVIWMEKVYHKELLTIMGGLGASLVAQLVKNPPANAGDLGLIPGLGRSPGEGKGYLLQCSGLEKARIQEAACPAGAGEADALQSAGDGRICAYGASQRLEPELSLGSPPSCRSLPSEHAKKTPFLLRCLISSLCWQSATTCQLGNEHKGSSLVFTEWVMRSDFAIEMQ